MCSNCLRVAFFLCMLACLFPIQKLIFTSICLPLHANSVAHYFEWRKLSAVSNRGRFYKLFCALRPTFEKLFRGVECALRRAPNFNRTIFMICAMRPTFLKLTTGQQKMDVKRPLFMCYPLSTSFAFWHLMG